MTDLSRMHHTRPARRRCLSSYLRGIASVFLLAAIALFTLQNLGPVEIQFLDWTVQSRRFVVIGGSFLAGLLVGLLLGWRRS